MSQLQFGPLFFSPLFMNHLQVFGKQHVLWELKAMLAHHDLTAREGWMGSYLSHTCNLQCPLAWPPSALIYENDSSLKSFPPPPGGCRSFNAGLVRAEVINSRGGRHLQAFYSECEEVPHTCTLQETLKDYGRRELTKHTDSVNIRSYEEPSWSRL